MVSGSRASPCARSLWCARQRCAAAAFIRRLEPPRLKIDKRHFCWSRMRVIIMLTPDHISRRSRRMFHDTRCDVRPVYRAGGVLQKLDCGSQIVVHARMRYLLTRGNHPFLSFIRLRLARCCAALQNGLKQKPQHKSSPLRLCCE